MAWAIIGPHHNETTIAALITEYPEIVAYQGGDEVPVYGDEDDCLSGCDQNDRILFWACEADSAGRDGAGDDGRNAIAEATWVER